jgi:ADP-L-glycero-D-manno-heptose 6-epimerase
MIAKGAVVVTGAAGFIGARFVEAMVRAGMPVASVDYHRRDRDAFASRPEHGDVDFGTKIDLDVAPDLLDRDDLGAVVHLGACSDTTEMDEAVLERLNVDYSKRLWDLCARRRVPFIYASSAATYGAGERGYDDDEARLHALAPLNPYAWSKHRFDSWVLEQERAGNAPPRWAGFKFFNVFGFGERHKGKMASMVLQAFDQIRADGRVRLFRSHKVGFTDGGQRRDFVCVDDVVDVLAFAVSGGVSRGIYNLGTGEARSFAELASAVFDALGRPRRIEYVDMPVPLRGRYQYVTRAVTSRLRAAGWGAGFTPLEEGVARYVRRLLEA